MDIVRYNVRMSRYRLQPASEQESALLRHCSDARYTWNLAVEQHAWWRPGRTSAPGYLEQSRQLTAARAANSWLAEGSQTVQQQALRDFDQAMRNFFAGTHRRPKARETDRRKDWVEKTSTDPARRFDVIRVEDLKITSMTRSASGTKDTPGRNVAQKTGLNRGIGKSGWGLLASRLEDVNAARNIAAGHVVKARGGDGISRPMNREPQLTLLVS
jgi:transposase